MKTSELTGAALDWAVAKCEGRQGCWFGQIPHYQPSTDWSQGGPIIERERIGIREEHDEWHAERWADNSGMAKKPSQRFTHNRYMAGPTPLVAAMRCFVASRLGDEVDIPEGLV